MYVAQSSNEYHHLVINDIIDRSRELKKSFVRLHCTGKIMFRDSRSNSGYAIETYKVLVYIYGRLMDYVLNELQIKDSIFVVGRTVTRMPNPYARVRCVQAECIYREDWMLYYPRGYALNPIDCEDINVKEDTYDE